MGAGFGVGEGVVVAGEGVAAGGGDGLELEVWKGTAKMPFGGGQGVVKAVFWIIHLIHAMYGFETALVKSCIVGNQRKTLDQWFNLFPYFWENRRIFSVLRAQSMNLLAIPLIVFRLRVNQTIESIGNLAVTHNNNPHAAYAGGALIGGLEVYSCKVFHGAGDITRLS